MNIALLDGGIINPGDLSWSGLNAFGAVRVYDNTFAEDVIERIGTAEAVITSKAVISKEVLKACPNIRYLGIIGAGYDTIDLEAAKEMGITVTNLPTYGSATIAQHAIALLLEIANRVGLHNQAVQEGRWQASGNWAFWDAPLIELTGKTLVIIGFGRIGRSVGTMAKALGMQILAVDEYQDEAGRDIATFVSQDEAFAKADIITLHCNLTPKTKGLINKTSIAKMKDGIIIINNSRGPLVVEQDLADALNSGKVAAAALDVVSKEPIENSNPLLHAKNCIITPHISWAAIECRQRIIDTTVDNLRAFVAGTPQNVLV